MTVEHVTFDKLQLRVRALEQKVGAIAEHLGLEVSQTTGPEVSPEIMDLLYQGDKQGAVKLYMQEAGVGLKVANETINEVSERI